MGEKYKRIYLIIAIVEDRLKSGTITNKTGGLVGPDLVILSTGDTE
jgi:hypothetical protein